MVVRLHESKRNVRLRYGVFVVLLGFVAGISSLDLSLRDVGYLAYENVASVIGISAAVEPNASNLLAQELERKERELTDKEKELAQREASLAEDYRTQIAANKRFTFAVLLGITILLLALIFLNFYLDLWRERKLNSKKAVHAGELKTTLPDRPTHDEQ